MHFIVFCKLSHHRQFAKNIRQHFRITCARWRLAVVLRELQRVGQDERIGARRGAGGRVAGIDPREADLLVAQRELMHEALRLQRDAQTLNTALGYEMNTIEFAVRDGVPYAIDFLNPAPDFERDRITPFYFDMVVQKMADLVIDRALHGQPQQTWPRWPDMVGLGATTPIG